MVQPQSREPITNQCAPSDYTNYFTCVPSETTAETTAFGFPSCVSSIPDTGTELSIEW